MNSVSASIEQMSANLNSVASAIEEMNSTIDEIARISAQGKAVTVKAIEKSKLSTERMKELEEAAKLIGSVTDTIKGISDQTNLLALNATIEAASAGEAGKGFAVVAGEIKELSRQTAKATEQINDTIERIQKSAEKSIEDSAGIFAVIEEIDQITNMISASIEEQSSTTSEISANISQTAEGVNEISSNVVQVSEAANSISKDVHIVGDAAVEIASASSQLHSSVKELSEFSERLNSIVSKYKVH